ncbi:MAG: 4Fe-4S binding protein [Sedimentisphaerales bacterium]|nr:4Fe-4S binding protein [Sedimentisphaerales bacterium]
MYIDQDACERCMDCIPVCPVGAIGITETKLIHHFSFQVVIDYETCVECGVCRRLRKCPQGAIKQVEEIPYPRILRAAFSDPTFRHASTAVLGRGTEEMKTNDVKNEFTRDNVGFSVEVGRPGVGAYFRDLQKVTMKAVALGGDFASYNPVVALMDKSTGALKEEVLNEKVLSAIAEFIVPREKVLDVLEKLTAFINAELESVATISVIARNDDDGGHSILHTLEAHGKLHGYAPYPNGKVNIGIAAMKGGNP